MASAPTPPPIALLGVAGGAAAVANSLSPVMMAAALKACSIPGTYVPLALDPQRAHSALGALGALGFTGCNVTMPFKYVAARIADSSSPAVTATGAANTLRFAKGGIHAEATDGEAVTDAAAAAGVELRGARVVVLGAGGAAAETVAACAAAGARHIAVWNRTPARAHALLERISPVLHSIDPALELQVHADVPIGDTTQLLVGCIPADALIPDHVRRVATGRTTVIDLAYQRDGRPTALQVATSNQCASYVDGREILVRQGALAFRVWFGVDPPTEVMRSALG